MQEFDFFIYKKFQYDILEDGIGIKMEQRNAAPGACKGSYKVGFLVSSSSTAGRSSTERDPGILPPVKV